MINPKNATGQEMASAVSDYLNIIGDGERIEEFVAGMARQHRTLQQGFTRLVAAWLKHLAALPENHYDARNEASVRFARRIIEAVKEDGSCLSLV